MVPVTQTIFGAPNGNCYAACLASILELPIKDVPNANGNIDSVNRFLATRGLGVVRIPYSESAWKTIRRGAWCILFGVSPRELLHAVVGKDGVMVHDPHPSRAGLRRIEGVDLFVARSPWKSKTTPI